MVGRIAAWLLAVALLTPFSGPAASEDTVTLKTGSGAHRYTVEVARNEAERAVGLMFRRTLPETSGMLFLYGPPRPIAMWMKNTYIPLDIIFISPEGTVHRIEENTEPFSTDLIPSGGKVVGVLELNAGQAAKINLKPGDQLSYPGLGDGAP